MGWITESEIRDEAKKAAERQEQLLRELIEEQKRTNALLERLVSAAD